MACLKASLIVCTLLSATNALAAKSTANLSDQQRIQRLERLMSSDILREQTKSMQSLREEISSLREQIEQQDYELESMKQRQRNLYIDMDRRISNAEVGGGNTKGASTAPVPPPNTSAPKVAIPLVVDGDVNGQEAYSQAFVLLKEGRYEHSIKAFEAFKRSYPKSKYADNAQYWLGEANYVSRAYKQALLEFQRLIAQYPESSKNSGARLKIGYVYFELKNWPAARDALQQVITLYPDTTVAKKANERLQRMKREGH